MTPPVAPQQTPLPPHNALPHTSTASSLLHRWPSSMIHFYYPSFLGHRILTRARPEAFPRGHAGRGGSQLTPNLLNGGYLSAPR